MSKNYSFLNSNYIHTLDNVIFVSTQLKFDFPTNVLKRTPKFKFFPISHFYIKEFPIFSLNLGSCFRKYIWKVAVMYWNWIRSKFSGSLILETIEETFSNYEGVAQMQNFGRISSFCKEIFLLCLRMSLKKCLLLGNKHASVYNVPCSRLLQHLLSNVLCNTLMNANSFCILKTHFNC